MTDTTLGLTLLQHGDSFFPSGAVSFSWGLETLFDERAVTSPEDLIEFLATQLRNRWATSDRCALGAAHKAGGDLEQVISVDHSVEVQCLASELRSGSRRTGLALLTMHKKLNTPLAAQYYQFVRKEIAPGHLAVIQGLVWHQLGLELIQAEYLSVHTLLTGLLGAAVRLGIVGHVDAQKALQNLQLVAYEILARPAPALEQMAAFTPQAEIAVMRHEIADVRLFAN